MKNSNKAMAAMAAGIGIGYMAAKKQYKHGKKPYEKIIEKIEDYMD